MRPALSMDTDNFTGQNPMLQVARVMHFIEYSVIETAVKA